MPTLHPQRPLRLAIATASAVVLGAVGLWIAPSLAAKSPAPSGASGGSDFVRVGSGALPTQAPTLRPARAPLSVQERGYAISLALASLPAGSEDVRGQTGAEVLVAELSPNSQKTTARLVTVVLYDYAHRSTTQVAIDLTRGQVEDVVSSGTVQLPPTETEVATALQIALTSDHSWTFRQQYKGLTGAPLVSATQVDATGVIWTSPVPAGNDAPTEGPCGTHRCLHLLISLPGGGYLATNDFAIDLDTREAVADNMENDR